MPTFTDRATRTLKLQKAERPKIGHGLPPVMDGFEGENRIQIVNGNPRLYFRTQQGWHYTGLSKDGDDPDLPIASSTSLGLIKIGDGGTISSDGTYTATAATPAADDITGGDAAVTISTSSGNITIDAAANDSDVIFKGTDNTSDITMLTLDGSEAGNAIFNANVTVGALLIMPDVTSTKILVADGTSYQEVAVSGDATLANNGALSLAAAQTNITSLLATDIKIGEDDQTKIDFETADEIHFYASNAEQVYIADGVFGPQSNNDVDLGTSGVEFKNAYFDGTVTSDAFAGPLTGDVTGTSSKVTVSDSSANTNFPIVFHDESDSLLDDTGALRYNPSTGTLLVAKATISGLSEQASEATALMINGSNVVGWRELGTAAFQGTGDFMAADASVNLATGVTNTLAVGNGGTGATTLNNLITLSTHTTGNYVATLTAGNLIDLQNNSGEGATPTIDVDLTEASEAAIANGDYILFLDGGATGTTKKEALADLASLLAGTSLSASNSVINVDTGDFMAADANINLGTSVTGTLAVGNGGIGATTLNNLITLSTHTTGNYVATLTAGNLIDLQNNSGEGASPTIDVDLTEASEAAIANGDYILFLDGGATGTTKKEALADFVSLLAGGSLSASNSVLSVDTGDFAAADHNQSAATITSGTLATGRGGTGQTSVTNFKNVLDDETWTFANVVTCSDNIYLAATKAIYFDGGSNTYIREATGDHINFYTGGNNVMTLDDHLEITGNFTAAGNIAVTKANAKITVTSGTNESASLRLVNDAQDWDLNTQTNDNFAIYSQTGSAAALTITPSTYNATFAGNIYGEADVYAFYSSDPVLKENKELIDNPLEKICKLGGYSFDWKESAKEYGNHLEGHDYGVMADEIQELFPELVQTRGNGIRAVKYDKLVPLLIEGIKELKQELNMIKGES